VDEQLRGPYRLWIHEHTFEARDRGTLVRDTVRYAVPLDWLIHRWVVWPDLVRIFAFHTAALRQRFEAPQRS
jgi:ligand-binding SRPBCC domain-containing protein